MIGTEQHLVGPGTSLGDAMSRLGRTGLHLTLFVVDADGRLLGSITDGDIRRALLGGATLASPVSAIMNTRPQHLADGEAAIGRLARMREQGLRLVPLVNVTGHVTGMVDPQHQQSLLPVDALIMAGGRGQRLRPFTDELPKPLLTVGGRPMIEHVIALLARFGIRDITISLNYLGHLIQDHLGDGADHDVRIAYLHEDRPMGTAGALAAWESHRREVLLMMNSDLLTDVALDRMYERFVESGADLAVATMDHTVDLPFAVMDLDGDRVRSFREKPSLSYPCNAGIYMMKRSVLQAVPRVAGPYHATDLVQDLLDAGSAVIAFPITGQWADIGRHEDLSRVRRDMGT